MRKGDPGYQSMSKSPEFRPDRKQSPRCFVIFPVQGVGAEIETIGRKKGEGTDVGVHNKG